MSDETKGREPRVSREDRRAFALAQRGQGKSIREIAALMGVSKSTGARLCEGVTAIAASTSPHEGSPGKSRTTRKRKKDEGSWWGVLAGLGVTVAVCIAPFFIRRPPGDFGSTPPSPGVKVL